ncbi:MAG TPA: hypothetical protein VI653_23320 [Steroidobacteraceae bacterium]
MRRWIGIAVIRILIVGVSITSVAPRSFAQEVPPEKAIGPAQPPQVVIEAQRQALRQRISSFVRTVTTQAGAYESLARWSVKVCPSTVGLPAQQNEFIAQRILTIARSAGIPVGDMGCTPNLRVMITSDPARLIKQMWSNNPGEFVDLSGQRATATEVRRFMEAPHPVRVWYGVELVGAMGNELGQYSELPREDRAPKVNTFATMSRIQIDDLQSIRSALVVVDKGSIIGRQLGAVADYVALVGLAEVNLAANYSSAESILTLFTEPENGEPIAGLSTWDAAFLKALYATEPSGKLHVAAIVNRMMKDPATAPVTPAATPP